MLGKHPKLERKTFMKKTNLEAFRAEPDVQAILAELLDGKDKPTKTDIINEAIRINGRQAALTVLEREVEVAKLKLAAVQRAMTAKK